MGNPTVIVFKYTSEGLGGLYNDGDFSWVFYGKFIFNKYNGILKFYCGAGQLMKSGELHSKNPAEYKEYQNRYSHARLTDLGESLILDCLSSKPGYLNNKEMKLKKLNFCMVWAANPTP